MVSEPRAGADIRIVVGLGNPGFEYEDTRHNVGFMVLDELARRLRLRFQRGEGEYRLARALSGGSALLLVKPDTYMNNSGLAVAQVLDAERAGPDSLLVVVDDVALPLGSLRLRARGSDGGHNGLYSVIYTLGTEQFSRLRCGIGPEVMPHEGELASFVLSAFEPGEREAVATMVQRAADAVSHVLQEGLERAMTQFNRA